MKITISNEACLFSRRRWTTIFHVSFLLILPLFFIRNIFVSMCFGNILSKLPLQGNIQYLARSKYLKICIVLLCLFAYRQILTTQNQLIWQIWPIHREETTLRKNMGVQSHHLLISTLAHFIKNLIILVDWTFFRYLMKSVSF